MLNCRDRLTVSAKSRLVLDVDARPSLPTKVIHGPAGHRRCCWMPRGDSEQCTRSKEAMTCTSRSRLAESLFRSILVSANPAPRAGKYVQPPPGSRDLAPTGIELKFATKRGKRDWLLKTPSPEGSTPSPGVGTTEKTNPRRVESPTTLSHRIILSPRLSKRQTNRMTELTEDVYNDDSR